MDKSPLTPNIIRKLIHIAEDKSFNNTNVPPRRIMLDEDENKRSISNQATLSKSSGTNYESSSGILDLDRIEGFGESALSNFSIRTSAAFNPGEITGRSTGTQDESANNFFVPSATTFEEYGRHSLAVNNLAKEMDKQTLEVNDIIRHSIATNYSFHSKRDLTADEASLVMREAPLPVQNVTRTNFTESNISVNNSNASVGAYFQTRCPDFGILLGKTDSPDRSMMPSISEVSSSTLLEAAKPPQFKMDQSLDCVPVRQPRTTNIIPEKPFTNTAVNQITVNEKESMNLCNRLDTVRLSNLQHEPVQKLPVNPGPSVHKSLMSNKPTDILLKNLQASMRMVTEDTEGSMENSFSISKITDYLGKQSNLSVTEMMQINKKKPTKTKVPLTEIQINVNNDLDNYQNNLKVTYLKDTRNMDTASTADTVKTVISMDKMEPPAVLVTRHSIASVDLETEDAKSKSRTVRSKSPSSKSRSTLSTVQENFTSFKSGDSPMQNSRGEANASHVLSPNIQYKELDKSVDWQEVLHQKQVKQESLAKEQWVEISTTPAEGFVGVSCDVPITITTLTDSWLTAKITFGNFPNQDDFTIELPRMPLLLSPKKTETFSVHITSNIEILDATLPFKMIIKDTSMARDIEEIGSVTVNLKMPAIQAISSDGVNKLYFPPMQEKGIITKSFVLVSDCPVDLKLHLSVVEGESIFSINHVQEVTKSEISRILVDRAPGEDAGKLKRGLSKQLCRITNGNAIKVTIAFNAPKLSELCTSERSGLPNTMATLQGKMNVNMIGVDTVSLKVDLAGVAGSANLHLDLPEKLHLGKEPTNITAQNSGTVSGRWAVKYMGAPGESQFPFKISPSKLELQPGACTNLTMVYTGPDDVLTQRTIKIEDMTTGIKTIFEIFGGGEKPKTFPIKTNYNNLSWVRAGRKEISLKNASEKRVQIRCQLVGEGFSIDLPGVESRGIYSLSFGPCECRPLPIVFAPKSYVPQTATLHLSYDKNTEFSRKIKLFGCATGEGLRWSGLVTYGDTALVRANSREPVLLHLYNKSHTPVFVSATVTFNLQYLSAAATSRLSGARCVVAARARHVVRLAPDWARVERGARAGAGAALAAVALLTGADTTRRRILRILKSSSNGDSIDMALLPDHLKVLAEEYEGENSNMDDLAEFHETKASLTELISGLQELTAQIDLPQDFAEDNTIIITDDTVIEHHTLCD